MDERLLHIITMLVSAPMIATNFIRSSFVNPLCAVEYYLYWIYWVIIIYFNFLRTHLSGFSFFRLHTDTK